MITNHPVVLQSLLALHHARYRKHRLIKALSTLCHCQLHGEQLFNCCHCWEKKCGEKNPVSSLSGIQLVEWPQMFVATAAPAFFKAEFSAASRWGGYDRAKRMQQQVRDL